MLLTVLQSIKTDSAAEESLDILVHLRIMQVVKRPLGEIRFMLWKFALEIMGTGREFASYLKTVNSKRMEELLEEIQLTVPSNPKMFDVSGTAITLRQVPRFGEFWARFQQQHGALKESLARYKHNPTKLSLARHCAVTIEHCTGIYMELSGFINNSQPMPIGFSAGHLFNAEFEEGYTWVVRAAKSYSTHLHRKLRLNNIGIGAAVMDKINSGVMFLALNPWDSSVIGFFILNVDIQTSCVRSSGDGGWVCAYYIEIDPGFEGCFMGRRIVEWIEDTSISNGYDALSVIPYGNDAQGDSDFWEGIGFYQSVTNQRWNKAIRKQ
jgi:hypothetical protein